MTTAIWLDQKHAKFFEFKPTGLTHHEIKRYEPEHHNRHPNDQIKDAGKYYNLLAEKIKDANQLIIMGPGLAKNHFHSHLEEHYLNLAIKVIAIKPLEELTDPQIEAEARKLIPVNHPML